jgi:hypothetical protein
MLYRDRGVSVTSDGSTIVLQRKSTEDGQLVRTTGSERAVDVVRTYTQSAVELGLWRNFWACGKDYAAYDAKGFRRSSNDLQCNETEQR